MPRIIRKDQKTEPAADAPAPRSKKQRHAPRPASERLGGGNPQPVLVIGSTVGDGRARLRQAMLDAGVAVELSMVHWGAPARRELQAIGNGRHIFRVVLIERALSGADTEALVRLAATRPRMRGTSIIVYTDSAQVPGEVQRLLAAGAADVWIEPYRHAEGYARLVKRLHYIIRKVPDTTA